MIRGRTENSVCIKLESRRTSGTKFIQQDLQRLLCVVSENAISAKRLSTVHVVVEEVLQVLDSVVAHDAIGLKYSCLLFAVTLERLPAHVYDTSTYALHGPGIVLQRKPCDLRTRYEGQVSQDNPVNTLCAWGIAEGTTVVEIVVHVDRQ